MAEPLARMQAESDGDRVRLRLDGEIDLSNARRLQIEIERAVTEHQPQRVVIDLGGVLYIDSQGLHLLLTVASLLARRRIALQVLAAPGTPAGDLLAMSQLDDLVDPGRPG